MVNLRELKPKPEPPRDRWSRYLIPEEDGKREPYTRATTVAKGMADTFGLEQWQQGQIANGMGRKPALVKLARSHPIYDEAKSVYKEIIEAAFEASDGADGRRAGTALHKQTERLDLGLITLDTDLDPDDLARLTEYQMCLMDNGITIELEHIEEILLFRGLRHTDGQAKAGWRIAGTADRIARLPDGRRVIADLKTGKNVDQGALEFAVQLAIYANHTDTYDAETDTVGERIEVDRSTGLIIHLPSQGEVKCELHTIDLNVGFGALICSMERREWQKEATTVLTPYRVTNPGSGGSTALRDWIGERIQRILIAADENGEVQTMANGDRHDAATLLVALWQLIDVEMPLPQTLTPDEVDNMDAVCSNVETIFELALPGPRPGQPAPDIEKLVTKDPPAKKKTTKKAAKKPAAKKTAAKKATKKAAAKKTTTRKGSK